MDIKNIRNQFPGLKQKINGFDLVYLDSAATTLKPQSVIDRINQFYTFENSNVHRGAHQLSQNATDVYEATRKQVAQFIGATKDSEIIFTKGTTEGINLIAESYGAIGFNPGDEILISISEHHANIVPWQILAEKRNLKVVFFYLDQNFELDFQDFKSKLSSKTKLVAISGCSNTLANFTDLNLFVKSAHDVGAKILVDGAQLVAQKKINVSEADIDFFVFSAHKLFGPTGIGVLYGKADLLNQMPPYQSGGAMISEVTENKTTFNEIPFKFEAGTPHISGVFGLAAAVQFFSNISSDELRKWEDELTEYFYSQAQDISDLILYGNKKNKAPIFLFNIKGTHHSDVAQLLDQQGIAVRAGHHCAQPLMRYLGVTGTLRASFSIYNSKEDVDKLIKALKKAKEILL